jgi:hypothetical protein
MGDTTICCICLDPKLPLQRLACGCKAAWFHPECCSQWIYHADAPYGCPVCRRHIPMTTNYSFSYQAGAPQKHLWHSLSLFGAEVVVCSLANTQIVWIFPFQSAAILLCPFILSSNQVYTYFLFHSSFLIFVKWSFTLFMSLSDSTMQGFLLLRMLGYVHLFALYCLHLIQYQNRLYGYRVVDPFEPYAISRDLVVAETLSITETSDGRASSPITEAPANTLEGDIPLASSGRSSRRRSRRR